MEKTKIFVSAICPIRNEEQNVQIIFNKFPKLIYGTELIFVEGGSKDSSFEKAKNLDGKKNKHGAFFRTVKQEEQGKGEAVNTGFNEAVGKYLIIVDADLSILPKDLKSVLSILIKNKGDIIASGDRLKGLKKPSAFYWINYIGNYFFRYYYSLILHENIRDVSCGTKAMKKSTWEKINDLRKKEGILDQWGDIDWLYYGRSVGAKILYVPIEYYDRRYGESKLQDLRVRILFAFNMFFIGIRILFRNLLRKT